MRSNYDTKDGYKVVLAGNSSVGKTCIVSRIQDDEFEQDTAPTISPGLCKRVVIIDEKEVSINIWDTAGQEKFKCMVPIYARNSCGVILVFDISNKSSFDSIDDWYKQMLSVVDNECKFILCGNKLDLNEDEVSIKASEWAKENNMDYVKVSAKSGENIELMLTKLVEKIVSTGPEVYRKNQKVMEILYGSEAEQVQEEKGCSC